MNVPQQSLDAWPRTCERLRGVLLEARDCLMSGHTEPALELIEFAYVAVMILGNKMQQAGADRPESLPIPPEIPLPLLSSRANRRYVQTLRQAYDDGLGVDRERGWGEEGPAQILKMLLTDVEMQVFGPQGCGEGTQR